MSTIRTKVGIAARNPEGLASVKMKDYRDEHGVSVR
jgi:hypothetical protein